MALSAQELIQSHLPTRKDEEWKYADLSFLQKDAHSIFKWDRMNEIEYIENEKKLVVRVFNSLSGVKAIGQTPKGVRLMEAEEFKSIPSSQIYEDFPDYDNYLINLGRALDARSLFLVITRDFPSSVIIEIEMGGQLPSATSPLLYGCHLNVIMNALSVAQIIEKLNLSLGYFHVSSIDYFLHKKAQARVLKLENGNGGRGGHTTRMRVEEDAELRVTTLTMNGEWSRHNAFAELIGSQAAVSLEAAYLLKDNQFTDHHTVIDHKVGNTLSVQKYNGVLSDKSKGVFNGKVLIRRDAQKASAVQLNKNLLLSKQAEINTKPELQIDADDVQAKHGATVGQLSEEQLFYLVSRGIPEKIARGMLARGFVQEVGLSLLQPSQDTFFKAVSSFVQDHIGQG